MLNFELFIKLFHLISLIMCHEDEVGEFVELLEETFSLLSSKCFFWRVTQ